MKTALTLVIILFSACTTDDSTSGQSDPVLTDGACHTNADCPPNLVCLITQPSATSTSPGTGVCVVQDPAPQRCNPLSTTAVACPLHERCNPICSSTGTDHWE